VIRASTVDTLSQGNILTLTFDVISTLSVLSL
jgi:hypothetical protein